MLKEIVVWIKSNITREPIQEKPEKEKAFHIWKKIDEIQERERLGDQVFRGEYVKALKDAWDLVAPIHDENRAREWTLRQVKLDELISKAKSGEIDNLFKFNFDTMKAYLHQKMGNIRRDQRDYIQRELGYL